MRGHARCLGCNVIVGYTEDTAISDDCVVLCASGTAASAELSQVYNLGRQLVENILSSIFWKFPLLARAAWQLQFSPTACRTLKIHVTQPFPQPAASDCSGAHTNNGTPHHRNNGRTGNKSRNRAKLVERERTRRGGGQ